MIQKEHRPYTKDEIIAEIESLPDDATIEDAMERLYFLAKLENGTRELQEGKGIPHEEVLREMAEWQE